MRALREAWLPPRQRRDPTLWLLQAAAVAVAVDLAVFVWGARAVAFSAQFIFSVTLHLVAVAALVAAWRALAVKRRKILAARDDELAEMSRRLECALEVSQIGFWDVDLDTDHLKWDTRACRHMGVPPRDGYFTEADWLGAVHPDDRNRAGAAAASAVEEGGTFVSDYRVVWPDGQVRHLRDMATVYHDRAGAQRLAGLVWDVTADKEREAELELRRSEAEAANIAKSNFLAAMSHEIRTPLTGVIGMLDLILRDPLPDIQAERARLAGASARSLLHLLNEVLDFSKLQAAAIRLVPVPVEPRRLIREVVDLMAARAGEKGVTLDCRLDEGVPEWVLVDPLRLRQVLTNIVSNAIAFTREGRITVDVGRSGPFLEIAVTDTGVGISDADCRRIFDRFVQADNSSSRPAGGSGLGLAIARELVELMGGRIGVESTLGRGSVFRFSVSAESCAAPRAEPDAPDETVGTPLDILLAEDNATNRYLINALLKPTGHRLTMVENGHAALDAARRSDFDVILMDIQMPGMDGLTAARAIRALPDPAGRVPIVALTASVQSDDRTRYEDAGMDACLCKPIDRKALERTLAAIAPRFDLGSVPASE